MSVQFTIDPLQDLKPISRYIYGINTGYGQTLTSNGYSNYTYQRLGGDLTTDWNWENGDSNAGDDYYYQNESLSDFTGGTDGPAGAAIPVLQSDYAQNAATLLTVPINGYVAANTSNDDVLTDPVTTVTAAVSATATVIPVANAAAIPSTPYYIVIDSEEMEVTSVNLTTNELTVVRGINNGNNGGFATPQANDPVYLSPDVRNGGANYLQTQFKQELPMKPGAPGSFTLTPDPSGQYVYEDEFVNWVNTMFPNGQTSSKTPIWFELDNEPDIWSTTHTEIQPTPVTYAELIQDSIEYSEAIKSVEPNALVFGPSSYGWEGYNSLQMAPDADGRDWLEYYLQQMAQASVTAGERLLDVLDVHFYTSTPDDPADVVQAPRSLWDPNYMENSWIAQSIPGPIELLPRLQAEINQYDPGTKLSISEYNYGDGDAIDGAIAEADALGIFGVQGLYAANEYQLSSNESYIAAAFNMYRDFDGNDGTFGDTSVLASTDDVTDSSIYASVDSSDTNVMTLVAINKSTQPLMATMRLNHVQPGATAAIYQLTGASTTPQYAGTVTISDPAYFTYTMPGYSVTTIRIVSPDGQGVAPNVASAARASPSSVTGISTLLSVLGADANGEPNLTYTWTTTTAPGPVTYSVNDTNAAEDTVATFSEAGNYSFLVTIADADEYFATSQVSVTVNPTLTHVIVTPADPTMTVHGEQQFTASSTDQFGNALSPSPSYSWSSSIGSITGAGVFTGPGSDGSGTITASVAGAHGGTSVSVVGPTTITVSTATDAALRDAINAANTDAANGDAATILFAASLDGDTIPVSSVPLDLKAGTGAIRIEGGGLITLSGDGKSQVFQVDSGARVTLDGLTIEDGSAAGSGGGIDNAGTLTITNSTLTGNTAGALGGGIENTGSLTVSNINLTGNSAAAGGGGIDNEQAGTASLTNATFSGNSASTGGSGGGISNAGTLTLINSTLTDNSASSAAGEGGIGGGIYNSGEMTATGSTIDDNTASYMAGGINNQGTMTVTNCTLAGNFSYLGGGIYNGNYYALSGALTLSNDTITSNFADYGAGGGIYMANGTTGVSTLTLFNTLVAGNYASGGNGDPLSNPVLPFGPDIQVYTGTVSGSYNLIGDGQGLTGISNGDANHNQVGTPTDPINALLAAPIENGNVAQTLTSPTVAFNQSEIPLTNNGGPTPTIALLSGSPAIGTGGAVTSVTGAVNSDSDSIPVADAAAIASSSGEYFILIDGEEMKVTDVDLANNVLTVVRAVNGVTAALQSNDPIYLYDDQRGSPLDSPPDIGAYQTSVAVNSISSISPVTPATRDTPVTSVDVTLEQPAGSDGFTTGALTLTDDGGPNLITGAVSIAIVSGSTYQISGLSGLTGAEGSYALTINAADINNSSGSPGLGSATTSWLMDTTPPTSTVNSLPSQTTSTTFTVSVTASDPDGADGGTASGVASIAIDVSTDGGPFVLLTTVSPTDASASFTGQAGDTYAFYSIATDAAGNVQPAPDGAQATTMLINTPATNQPMNIAPIPTRMVIIGQQAILQRKTNKNHKPTGKTVLSGITLDFRVPLNSSAAVNAANYHVDTITTKTVKKKKQTTLHPITNFTVSYLATSDSVEITFEAKQTFPTGGQITVLGGLTTASGGTLSGNAVFTISKGGNGVSLAQ